MLRDCVVIAVEGTHASGKTTLAHALAAHYRERGIHAMPGMSHGATPGNHALTVVFVFSCSDMSCGP